MAEALGKFAQLDILLPSQYFKPPGKRTPEHRLMMAVLHDALHCLEKYRFARDSEGRLLFHEARKWLLADEVNWPYSFESICRVLDLDSEAVLSRLGVAD